MPPAVSLFAPQSAILSVRTNTPFGPATAVPTTLQLSMTVTVVLDAKPQAVNVSCRLSGREGRVQRERVTELHFIAPLDNLRSILRRQPFPSRPEIFRALVALATRGWVHVEPDDAVAPYAAELTNG